MKSIPEFIGLDTSYPTASGTSQVRLHLDGAASPLAARAAIEAIETLLPHYSNSHSYVHSSAQITTQAQAWAHNTILEILGADKDIYTAIFTGSGTTSAINRLARGLASSRPDRKCVLVSAMEHHANDLPHRQFDNNVIYIPLTGEGSDMGAIDLDRFKELCQKHADDLNYVAVSSISNVTGIRNPISEMASIAHQHGALLLVDGAQAVAHGRTNIDALGADFFVFSGHKLYTPMSPGVLIANKKQLNELGEQDLGGGSVSSVSFYDYQLLDEYPHKEQSGTPNIVGAIALAKVLRELEKYGFEDISQHDESLMKLMTSGLSKIDGVRIYGDANLPRVGALAFNHRDIDHGLLAAILNDYFAIAVRNECFCAHPYVSSLIKQELWQLDLGEVDEEQQEGFINRKRGMVRASISLYNTPQDVARLVSAVEEICGSIEQYEPLYSANQDGSYNHKSYRLDWQAELGLTD